MEKLIILVAVGLSMIVGCDNSVMYNQRLLNEVKKFYEAPHQIRKMFVRDDEVSIKEPNRSHFSGGFFLFLGGISGKSTEGVETRQVVTHVRFAWETKDNTYVISTLPLEKIRIKLVEKIDSPTVSFFLDKPRINEAYHNAVEKEYNLEERKRVGEEFDEALKSYFNDALDKYLAYVILTVQNEDWPANINLPINHGFSN